MMNKVFGGTVHKKNVREDGAFNIGLDNTCSLFRYCIFSCRPREGLAYVFMNVHTVVVTVFILTNLWLWTARTDVLGATTSELLQVSSCHIFTVVITTI